MGDYKRRLPIASNHTMTHVLNYALRKVLQKDIDQKGSLNDAHKLRFDFSYNAPLTMSQLEQIQQVCFTYIQNQVPVKSYIAPLEQAKRISSLRAVFGEVYPDPVRIISIAPNDVEEILALPENDWDYSIELCGGTHLQNTRTIQSFVILQEEGIAKGIRRVTAVTGDLALDAIKRSDNLLHQLHKASNTTDMELLQQLIKTLVPTESISAIVKQQVRDELTNLGKKIFQYKKEQAANKTQSIIQSILALASNPQVVYKTQFGLDGKIGKNILKQYEKKTKTPLFLMSHEHTKCIIFAFIPKGGTTKDCKQWILHSLQGLDVDIKGGGKPNSAQYAVDYTRCPHALDHILEKANHL